MLVYIDSNVWMASEVREWRGCLWREETVGVVLPAQRSAGSRGMGPLGEGERLLTEERYQEAASRLEEALEAFQRENYTEGIRAALGNLSLAYRFLHDKKKASVAIERLKGIEEE